MGGASHSEGKDDGAQAPDAPSAPPAGDVAQRTVKGAAPSRERIAKAPRGASRKAKDFVRRGVGATTAHRSVMRRALIAQYHRRPFGGLAPRLAFQQHRHAPLQVRNLAILAGDDVG